MTGYVYYKIYVNGNLHMATTDIHQHQGALDYLHSQGYEPIEERVKVRGN
jgi:hypothetical protein